MRTGYAAMRFRPLGIDQAEAAFDAVEPVAKAIDAERDARVVGFKYRDPATDFPQIGFQLGNVVTDYPQPLLHSQQETADPLQVNVLR
jgi:hypothetical protein